MEQETRESLRKAIVEIRIRQAIEEIDVQKFNIDDLPDVFSKLIHESPTAQVLIAVSYLEEQVKKLIMFQLRDLDSKTKIEGIFGNNGPLSTLSNRLRLSYHLGWMNKETFENVNRFRSIRNHFAHKAYNATFSDKEVRDDFKALELQFETFFKIVSKYMSPEQRATISHFDELGEARRKVCAMALIVHTVCVELALRPAAKNNGVGILEITQNRTPQCETFWNLTTATMGCLTAVASK